MQLVDEETSSGGPVSTQTPTPTPEDHEISVQVIYGDNWEGSISVRERDGDSTSKSISDIATVTFDIDEEASYVSANAQKQDDSKDEITIQIVVDGQVVAEESSTAPYGVVQVSKSID